MLDLWQAGDWVLNQIMYFLWICLVLLPGITQSLTSEPFVGTIPAYIVKTFNDLRSRIALGRERWFNGTCLNTTCPIDENVFMYWPSSKRTYQLKWDAALALNASKRLISLFNSYPDHRPYPVPSDVREISVGLVTKTYNSNNRTAQEMFDRAYYGQWYSWLHTHAVPSLKYQKSKNDLMYHELSKGQTYKMLYGETRRIGCAYSNVTDENHFRLLCQLWPNPPTVGVNIYPPAYIPCEICSGCPAATAPCNKATGLCIVKAAAGK